MKWGVALALVLCALAAIYPMRINGDGGEYLMTMHALAERGSVAITPDDFAQFVQRPASELAAINYPLAFYRELLVQFSTPQPRSWGGYASVRPDQLYSMHFWLYSLLSVPLYALLRPLGGNPVWALGLTNLAFCMAAAYYLRRHMPACWHYACILFAALGTSFYVAYTGPEIMTASCFLIAVLALAHGRFGTSVLACGMAASQSPSVALLLPLIFLFWWVKPARGLLAADPPEVPRAPALVQAGVGMLALAAPYLFFLSIFGVASLTGKYFTSFELISAQRFVSLLFDVDQGMIAGVPGLFVGLLASVWLIERHARARFAGLAAICLCAFTAAAIPTLAALNWNSGAVVFMRYAYWLAMPMVALLMMSMQFMTQRSRRVLLALVLGTQAVVLFEHGPLGGKTDYLSHTKAGTLLLDHFPERYHPDPEIFIERGTGAEVAPPLSTALVHLHRVDGQPRTLLRHREQGEASAGLCPAGHRLEGSRVQKMQGGWEYVHGTFSCKRLASSELLATLSFGSGLPDSRRVLPRGWHGLEADGVWSAGQRSEIVLPAPARAGALRIWFDGSYFGGVSASEMRVNGQALGPVMLGRAPLLLQHVPAGRELAIVLSHPQAASPASRGESADTRILAFRLRAIRIEAVEGS